MMKRYVLLLSLAACGGGGGGTGDDIVDAAANGDSGTTPDAGSCTLGSSRVLEPGGLIQPAYVYGAEAMSNGEVAILAFDGANGAAALTWDGNMWAPHSVYTNTSGGFGGFAFGELAGEPAVFATIFDQSSDSGFLRMWLQLANGNFANGERIDPSSNATEAQFTRWSPSHQVLSVAADNQQNQVVSYERTIAGTWTIQPVAFLSGATETYAAGVGELADGTAAIAVSSNSGFDLYRRTGQSWGLYHNLAGGAVYDAHVEFPPEGSSAGDAVAIWTDYATGKLRGEMISLATGAPTGAGDLLPDTNLSAHYSSIVFDADGSGGKILVVDGNFNTPRAWIVPFQGTSFEAAQELRPDLVFDGYPHLMWTCDGYLIEHATRLPTDAFGTEPLMLEPLADFAP